MGEGVQEADGWLMAHGEQGAGRRSTGRPCLPAYSTRGGMLM